MSGDEFEYLNFIVIIQLILNSLLVPINFDFRLANSILR